MTTEERIKIATEGMTVEQYQQFLKWLLEGHHAFSILQLRLWRQQNRI